MKVSRSASQILFGFLPGQTVDLNARVWRVKRWNEARVEQIDRDTLVRELVRQAMPWQATGRDAKYVEYLLKGFEVRVLSLNRDHGVFVEPYPDVWICKACSRMALPGKKKCACGTSAFAQLQFVGYCQDCGQTYLPDVPKCSTHKASKIILPGTASARDIRFVCPDCHRQLRKGLGAFKCRCGTGNVTFTVHRAASVFTPRSIVLVNPPSLEKAKKLAGAGGPPRALQWVVDGMVQRTFEDLGPTRLGIIRQLVDSGIPQAAAEAAAHQLAASLPQQQEDIVLPPERRVDAEREAVTVALALSESRTLISDVQAGLPVGNPTRSLLSEDYPRVMEAAGVESVELVDKFPVLTGFFGFTRGDSSPGVSLLNTFRDKRGSFEVYADVAETEALFVRLRPSAVSRWLAHRGVTLESWSTEREARLAILRGIGVPAPGATPPEQPTPGSLVLTLVHSIAHRLIRKASVIAGVDRNALSELLVPLHLGFFIYAAARGDFVLGGLQALFETELHNLLLDVAKGDHRCALDPGCSSGGGACVACLHLGETSCRYYNQFLDRSLLTGVDGFFPTVVANIAKP